ncbi:MAG: hypothetical protein QXV69_05640 [Sulfolobaceae archaeon]
MTIIVRKTHKKGEKRIWIRIGESPPVIKEGKIKDGAFFVIVGDDEGEKKIRLTDQEALDIANRIIIAYRKHIRQYMELDKMAYAEYKQRVKEEEKISEKEIELELLEYLIKNKGEVNIEDLRKDLGVKHADEVFRLERKGIVKIIENKVRLLI